VTPKDDALDRIFREESGLVLGALVAELRDLDLAEDAFQDAVEAALEHWPTKGVPGRPGAWLLVVARRKALDRLRRARTRSKKQVELERDAERFAPEPDDTESEEIPDERLRLMFTCCHPTLSRPAQVALTLRTLGGLTTAEIARAFLTDEVAMSRRLVRAKAKLREERVPYRVPPAAELPERIDALLAVIYLIFNEGYAASAGDALVRRELCGEAIRLARVVVRLLPGKSEARGLAALLLLVDARREARVHEGVAVTLEEQDRGRWDRSQIAEGRALLAGLASEEAGSYELQARIAEVHVAAERFEDTEWPAIVALYDRLLALQPSPVVELNRAVAVGLAEGPEVALRLLLEPRLEKELGDYLPYRAARADLLRRAGRSEEARLAYRAALEKAGSAPERAFLSRRLADLAG
jgi:RNA polymerase sigma-70 factor (ECF subfamily)